MIIIFGLRRLRKSLGSVLLRCANCGMSPLALLPGLDVVRLVLHPGDSRELQALHRVPQLQAARRGLQGRHRPSPGAGSAIRSGHEGTADASRQPATLNHAVNEWAGGGTHPSYRSRGTGALRVYRQPTAGPACRVVPGSSRRTRSALLGQYTLDGADDDHSFVALIAELGPVEVVRSGYVPLRSRWSHPGQQQGRRMPSSSSSCVRRMRGSRVVSCLAFSTQQMNSLRASGVMSFQASSAVGLATSATLRSWGSLCTTPPGTLAPLTASR